MVKELKRWALMNKVFVFSLFLILAFAYWDNAQVLTMKEIDERTSGGSDVWEPYWNIQQPVGVFVWYFILFIVGLIWLAYTQDLSEAAGLFITASLLIYFGVQDLIYFAIGPDSMTACMEWASVIFPVRTISNILGESCISPTAFILSGILGILIAYWIYPRLKRARW